MAQRTAPPPTKKEPRGPYHGWRGSLPWVLGGAAGFGVSTYFLLIGGELTRRYGPDLLGQTAYAAGAVFSCLGIALASGTLRSAIRIALAAPVGLVAAYLGAAVVALATHDAPDTGAALVFTYVGLALVPGVAIGLAMGSVRKALWLGPVGAASFATAVVLGPLALVVAGAGIGLVLWRLSGGSGPAFPVKVYAIATGSALALMALYGVLAVRATAGPTRYQSLATAPDSAIAGTIAFVREGCVHTVPASGGSPTKLACRQGGVQHLRWTTDGRIQAISRDTVLTIDPTTGGVNVAPSDPWKVPPEAVVARGGRIRFRGWGEAFDERGGRCLTFHMQDMTTYESRAVEYCGSARYGLARVFFSPDGRWVLIEDNLARLLITRADPPNETRLLVEDGSTASWYVRSLVPTWTVSSDPTDAGQAIVSVGGGP